MSDNNPQDKSISINFSDRPLSPAMIMLFPAADEKARNRAVNIIKALADEHDLFVFAMFDNPTAKPDDDTSDDSETGQLYIEMRPDTPFDAIATIPKRLMAALKTTTTSPVLTSKELRPMAADGWIKSTMNLWMLEKLKQAAAKGKVSLSTVDEAIRLVPQALVYQRGADQYHKTLLDQLNRMDPEFNASDTDTGD